MSMLALHSLFVVGSQESRYSRKSYAHGTFSRSLQLSGQGGTRTIREVFPDGGVRTVRHVPPTDMVKAMRNVRHPVAIVRSPNGNVSLTAISRVSLACYLSCCRFMLSSQSH